MQVVKALVSMCVCADWDEASLLADAELTKVPKCRAQDKIY